MVIPWIGFPLADLIKKVEPQGKRQICGFRDRLSAQEMPGLQSAFPVLDWPYVEGLRLDEAMNPLAILAVGLYGETLPNQNGAPIRLVVPWKYGFKGIKSISRISFVEKEPPTSWNRQAPDEYGFYANVNPAVDHPALEPGHRAAHRRGQPFCQTTPDAACSTAMPNRLHNSMRAWT